MDLPQDKFAPTYDELPEVFNPSSAPGATSDHGYSSNLAYSHNFHAPGGPAEKIPAFDTADKEVVHWPADNGSPATTAVHNATESSATAELGSSHKDKGSGRGDDDTELAGGGDTTRKPKLICGFPAKMFWLVIVVAVLVVAAAVGGGVGGGIAAGKGKSGDSDTAVGGEMTPTSSPTTLSSSASSSSPSTSSADPSTTPVTPSPNRYFAFQAFEQANFTGASTSVIKVEGALGLPFNSSSYIWQRNGTACCTTFCIGKSWVGWWCQDKTQPEASRKFDNIEIGCSGAESEEYSMAKCAT
ncbi:uncharacterized protein B0I36DRAFT_367377 [Microdochium trichocladiopsis]|uniref:Uncharacterized protein n=1 Tax=Microdochium trichocladiopsis TaxID=1682393 RepID=A0A9P8XVX5_9PEZI|nr:uncharacterized protein B0I36DRAFT_367377 [Microdochium trichocladiopsis]KAH7020901.1 hypothetical protein B0I36DRAFT_367377 [Microdochium trichocladiopsis]